MKKNLLLLLLCSIVLFGCTNISDSKTEKAENSKEVSISNDGNWPTFTDEEIEVAKNFAKEHYKHMKLPHDIENIEYIINNDDKDKIYPAFLGSTSNYKNSNTIIFLAHTKDEDSLDQSRIIVLKRENKDSNWKVVDEGL